jgi:F-type H+-transporting ATPase subunit gamma
VRRLLPIERPVEPEGGHVEDYLYEPTPGRSSTSCCPRYVEIQIYQAMLESSAAEHGARMAAMEAATTNAGEMVETLTLYLNRVRQATITKEIIEVVSGAQAL